MTKEEVIDYIIERYKEYKNKKGALGLYDCCHGIDCYDCPFENPGCDDDIAMSLLDRLIKAEEHQETNLEHYIITAINVTTENDSEIWIFIFKRGTQMQCFDSNSKSVLDWLLAPYEEPKPKYKLSKLEFDLLDYCCYKQQDDTLKDWTVLKDMHDKGHYKGIPEETKIRDILGNCEVVEE